MHHAEMVAWPAENGRATIKKWPAGHLANGGATTYWWTSDHRLMACYIAPSIACTNSPVFSKSCYSLQVISRQFRDLRTSQGKTQREVADGGGFPRSQLQLLERGGNVTLATLQKAISQLDGMRLEIVPTDLDVEEVRGAAAQLREIATQLLAVSDRFLQALGPAPPAPSPAASAAAEGPLPGGGGATRHEAAVDPALLERLEQELDEALRARKPQDDH
jgi:transcriptional regulator with XRE-family HTH domain